VFFGTLYSSVSIPPLWLLQDGSNESNLAFAGIIDMQAGEPNRPARTQVRGSDHRLIALTYEASPERHGNLIFMWGGGLLSDALNLNPEPTRRSTRARHGALYNFD
jgi:hypothetical protein